jgi:hypothetical protein
VDFRLGFSIDTIGPLQFEYILALIVATGLARLAALLAWTLVGGIDDRARRVIYGGIVILLIGLVVLALPSVLVVWLYSLTHPQAIVCSFIVWPGLLLPLGVYCWGLMRLARRDRRDNRALAAH